MDPKVLERLRGWAELRNGIASLWLFNFNKPGPTNSHDFAVELRPTKHKNDWALAEWAAYGDIWKADLSRIMKAKVDLVAFRDASDRPFDPAAAQLIWERTKVIGEV